MEAENQKVVVEESPKNEEKVEELKNDEDADQDNLYNEDEEEE